MRYPPQILEEIRARLPVSAVVGKRVRLKKAGREWRGLSPFNAEKTPSFYVNDQKQFYHCFSSGKHGDIFTFLMETEGLSFPEAVERLAGEAGVPLPKLSREDRAEEVKRKSLYDVMELAAEFFEDSLQGRFGAKARDYLAGRSLSRDTQARFRIGYAPPERYALRDHLAAKDVSIDMMVEAGLLFSGEDVKVPYDRFRDRVMFPICDMRGRVVAFGGRAMSADVPAKYLNSPDTPLFNKGRLLYNYHLARQPAHDRGTVIAGGRLCGRDLAVRGRLSQCGGAARHGAHGGPTGAAVAHADEPILCFDGDKAGRRAAFRALDVALPNLDRRQIAALRDPARGTGPGRPRPRRGHGGHRAGAGKRQAPGGHPVGPGDGGGPLDTPERRAGLEQRLRESLAPIRDDTLKRYYREDIENRISALNPDPRGGRFHRHAGGQRRDRRGPRPTLPSPASA